MRAILPSRSRATALLFLTICLGGPSLASAQLFPNLPIRRQRPPCEMENPQYRMIRQEYWGHYPTCWRRFPPGWGCPSPEVANWEKSKADIKLVLPTGDEPDLSGPSQRRGGGGAQPNDDTNPNPPRDTTKPGDTGIPALPNDTKSPFDNDPKAPSTSPFDTPANAPTTPNPDATRPMPPRGGDAGSPPPATPPGDAPRGSDASNLAPTDTPPPLAPGASAAAPRRGRSLIAGLWTGRRR